ncbi:MAG: rRNA maturation RNase YbeY [Deltaproteobacteria bacterium]|nr:rRNA maturation RNase YbeY [Deltaproteobacteria bacterium]
MKVLITDRYKRGVDRGRVNGLTKAILKGLGCSEDCEISILLLDDEGIRGLNKRYLKRDRPTDVLSFPMEDPLPTSHFPVVLGDVVISVETAERQAKEFGVSLGEEMVRLLIHGILHLLGLDHKGGKASVMKREEERLMSLLKEGGWISKPLSLKKG